MILDYFLLKYEEGIKLTSSHRKKALKKPSLIKVKDFMNVCENCAAKLYSFLVNDTMFSTDKSLFFRCNLLNRIEKVIMTIDEKIRDEKLVCIVNRKIALLSAKLINMNIVFESLVVTALTLLSTATFIRCVKLL